MDTYIEMKTSEGDIIVGLYEKTPIHSNHFKQVCESNTYDSLLIHQIGPDGIIIAGDTASKNADVNYL
ncbi:MAG: peptidylprolyl isomerase, partial [Bacteroidales bacterium]|nr:peptidylprolyl isomerase [Bacteroidales bacterium]